MQMRFAVLAFGIILAAPAAHAASPVANTARPPACTMNQLSLALDGENGSFDGMSHGGTLLVLRNIGPKACTVPGYPAIIFRDEAKAALPISRQIPPGMHPGPVIVPAIVAPGAEVTSSLRWISGNVVDDGKCLTPATLAIALEGAEQVTAFGAPICGAAAMITYTMTPLRPDPVYVPQSANLSKP